jgi:hypothetical protein
MDVDKTDCWIVGLLDEEAAVFSLFWSNVAAGDGGRFLPFRPAGRLCHPHQVWQISPSAAGFIQGLGAGHGPASTVFLEAKTEYNPERIESVCTRRRSNPVGVENDFGRARRVVRCAANPGLIDSIPSGLQTVFQSRGKSLAGEILNHGSTRIKRIIGLLDEEAAVFSLFDCCFTLACVYKMYSLVAICIHCVIITSCLKTGKAKC